MSTASVATARAALPSPVEVARFDVLGVPVSAVDLDTAQAKIEQWIDAKERRYVCITGVHGVVESLTDPDLQRGFERAGLVTPDGMPLVWIARLRGVPGVRRVYGPDLMTRLSGQSARPDLRHYYFGGGDGVAELLARRLTERNPDLRVVGHATPPFRSMTPEEEQRSIDAINAADPDILWIGLSTPKQDLWMARYRDRIDAPVIIGVGAAFDFLSGTKRQAPVWLRGTGLEWLFRLVTEPRRLWRRYARIVPIFGVYLALEGALSLLRVRR